MSADFWTLTQRTKWQLTRYLLHEQRRRLLAFERKMIHSGLVRGTPEVVHDANTRIYLHNLLAKLGRRLNIRQVALATAEIYLTRFLTRVSLKEVNPYLLVTTCLYVACKIEECPQHIRFITLEARNLWPEYIPQDITKVAEFEFYLIEEMDLYLVVHHPYKALLQLRDYFSAQAARTPLHLVLTDDELQNSWSIINDSYITDLHLLFPPHIIAITAVYITVVVGRPGADVAGARAAAGSDIHIDDLITMAATGPKPAATPHNARAHQFKEFLARSHVNLNEVVEALQDLINLYAVWNRYDEAAVKKAILYMFVNR